MENKSLIQVKIESKGEKIGLTNYSDLLVFDRDNKVVAIRIGGYPESVQAMSDIIRAGCDLKIEGSIGKMYLNTKGKQNYERKISHDGIYAEGMHYLKDDIPSEISLGNSEEGNGETKVALKKNLYFFCKDNEELYEEIDRKLAVPLIPEFKEYMLSELKAQNILKPLKVYSLGKEFYGWHMEISSDEKEVSEILEKGIKEKKISIPGGKGNTEIFKNISSFTQYLGEFGNNIAEKIKESFKPRFDPSADTVSDRIIEVNNCVINSAGYSLFDAQLGAAEALRRQLEADKMALLVAECGTGKTKIGSTALYAYQHSNPKRKTFKKAFNVVICPSHITGKWVREIHETIPNSFAVHVTSMAEVDALYDYYLKENKSIYLILSKETARNGYMRKPAVIWNPVKKGFVCPHCGHIQEMTITDGDFKYTVNADAGFFLNENSENHKCQNKKCKEILWEALNKKDIAPKRNPWVRIGSYGFIHRKFVNQAYYSCRNKAAIEKIRDVLNDPDGIFPAPGAFDRYPLSSYVKRKVRKIDGLIVDELHQYSGESAQGQAMAELAGVSEKVIGMTATLVNGYAKGIFYLLFRLKSHLMLLDDQDYQSPNSFCRQYGVVEDIYSVETPKAYNSTSKATKRKIREKSLPGISPIVYTRFLLENAVFLSLADMGKELPDYEEIPIFCEMNENVKEEYNRIEKEFKKILKEDKKIGNRILSASMNLLSAYPDQPYGHEPIINPFMGEEIIVPKSIGGSNVIQPKDSKVLELVKQKVAKGERVIIYTAWTRLDSQDKLFKVLNENGIPTVILKSTVPTVKREEWVENKVKSGIKVIVTNCALVETGLDLNDFTTLIFYNIAYNLYIFRQASRRSWRINQTAPKVEVYMFYYKDTMQQRALKLMASKLGAATVIEGNLSDEGLASMSDCEDLTTQLAKELMSGLKENVDDLSASYKKMAIVSNREEKQIRPTVITEPIKTVESPIAVINPPIQVVKTQNKKYDTGQLSIFDLLAS